MLLKKCSAFVLKIKIGILFTLSWNYCQWYGPQKSSYISGTTAHSARHFIKIPQVYNPTKAYVHNMSAPHNNIQAQAFIQVIHRHDAAVKTRKQKPAIEVIWSLITVPDAASPICSLYSLKQMSPRQ